MGTMGDTLASHTTASQMSSFFIDKIGLFSVKSYGATGDGVTDDTAAVQAAVTAAVANGNNELFFPHGTYYVTALTGEETLIFTGDNSTFTGGYIGYINSLATQIANAPLHLSYYEYLVSGSDWGVALNQALADAHTEKRRLRIGTGTYQTSILISMNDTVFLDCEPGVVIQATTALAIVFKVIRTSYAAQQCNINNLIVDGNDIATTGVWFDKISMPNFSGVNGLLSKNCVGDAIVFDQCQGGAFYNVKGADSGGKGVRVTACNNAKFFGLSGTGNVGDGVFIENSVGGSGACHVYGIYAESNTGHGIVIDGVTSLAAIYGGWAEGNTLDALNVDGYAYVTGVKCIGVGTGTNRAIRVTGDNAIVENCSMGYTGDATYYDTIIDGDSIVRNILVGSSGIDTETIALLEGSEMLTNANCESATVGWSQTNTTLTPQSTDQAHGGTYSVKCVAAAANAVTYESLTGVLGEFYHVKFYVWNVDITGIRLRINDGVTNVFTSTVATQGAWVLHEAYIVAKGTSLVVNVLASGSGGTYYIDDCSVKLHKPAKISTATKGTSRLYETVLPTLLN